MPPSTLLLVDDEEPNHHVFQHVIARHLPDCTLRIAWNVAEGLELAERIHPDCAVLDVFLPDGDGIELCRRLKSNPATAHFPVLLMSSAEMDAELRVVALEAGADDFLQRPCEQVDLILKLRAMLRIKRAEDELRAVNKSLAELASERSKALHEYDERYRMLFDVCSDAVLAFDIEQGQALGRFIEVNEAACRRLGYAEGELLQLRLKDLIPPDRVSGLQGRIESILKHKQIFFETILLRRDETPLPVAMHARVFGRGERHTIMAVLRELSVGGESAEEERFYRMLAVQTGQMIYDCDLQAGDFHWGGAVTQVTGYTPEEMGTFTWHQLMSAVHPDDQKRVLNALREAMDAVSTYQIESRVQHRSGEYRYVENIGIVLPGEDGRAYRLLGTIKDITARVHADEDRHRAELEMQHSQRLESLGVLAGGIAHDFNNILAAIIGLTDMALQDIPKNSPTHADLKESLQAAHRAKDLVKQILMFSRQSGEERAPLYLHIIVREALKLLRATIPATIEIIDSVDVHSGAVMANTAQMHQVIMNYCTNAVQAMAGRWGRLEVRLTDMLVDERLAVAHPKLRPGPYVRLSVIDTGHGMEPQVLRRIFDPFFTTKGPGEGTGMGLAVVHGIVTNHGGIIVVESIPGKGSTFHTYLPRVNDVVLPEESHAESMPRGTERILFADDEEVVMRFCESMLPRLGYEVTFCLDGDEALEVFQKNPTGFDLVITDQLMPRMTGDVLASEIRKIRPEIPILLFTGFSDRLTDQKIRAAGIKDVILKPVIASDLAKRIRQVLDA